MSKIVYVVAEDHRFASHFLPIAREAIRLGFDVTVVTSVRDHANMIEATGARVLPLDIPLRSHNPKSIFNAVRRLVTVFKTERPAIVHCIGLGPILLGGLAAAVAKVHSRVYAVTGWGYTAVRRDVIGGIARASLRVLVMGPLRSASTAFLFENDDDPLVLGLDPQDENVTIVGGAGIDLDAYPVQPLPETKTLRIALVTRFVWLRGIDTAIKAVHLARGRGADVELSLFGFPDPGDPGNITASTLRVWSAGSGVTWHGAATDIQAVWRDHHVACLPSRGGEGLPRTLLESAASGRLSLTTDVAGCRKFVRHNVDGYVLPVDDIVAFADVMVALAVDRERVRSMGLLAAERVRHGFTIADVSSAVGALYLRLNANY
ncbi:glycosyltransferase [Rhizobium leucaenae]|uniref:glycosyltransferase n=1 Tax=Rhizobium leucaenae TaxID=29450 RepID=UPI0012E9BD37|nr:glycosyltransferase [Rhizobium leucaenae]